MEGAAVASIIQRWEWRTFGEGLRAAEKAFATLTPTQVVDSDELYLLSASDGNVKVRDDLLDIKLLREVDDDGLERWEPVLKAAFPVTAAEGPRGLRGGGGGGGGAVGEGALPGGGGGGGGGVGGVRAPPAAAGPGRLHPGR